MQGTSAGASESKHQERLLRNDADVRTTVIQIGAAAHAVLPYAHHPDDRCGVEIVQSAYLLG